MRMSEGTNVDQELLDNALRNAPHTMQRLQIGYVVIDRNRTPVELREFAQRAFELTHVMADGPFDLYRTPLAPPLLTK
jgi:hypothetical protein